MDIREVKIEEYWPLIVKGTEEFGQIAAAENPEFNILAGHVYDVLKDSFIHDATEYGVKRWESILKLTPAETDTLDDRKARILTQLSVKIPYTWRVLEKMVGSYLTDDQWVMEYVNDEGKLIIHTDRVEETKLQTIKELLDKVLPANIELVQYNHHIEVSWRDINKYAECQNGQDMLKVNPLFRHDVTSDLEWVYPLSELRTLSMGWEAGVFSNRLIDMSQPEPYPVKNKAKKLVINIPKCTNGNYGFIKNTVVEEIEINAPLLTQIRLGICDCVNLTSVKGYLPRLTDGYKGFGLGSTKLSEFDIELPSLSSALFALHKCIINKASALRILNSIPSYTSGTHPLTLGIHIDHQQDEEVLAAIANAEAKGWTLTVQWNGTPTAATASTFGMGTLIYAKVSEIERPDGTTEKFLDWGHYVTDETGYETFRSLESAYKYFNLEMPEQEEITHD